MIVWRDREWQTGGRQDSGINMCPEEKKKEKKEKGSLNLDMPLTWSRSDNLAPNS